VRGQDDEAVAAADLLRHLDKHLAIREAAPQDTAKQTLPQTRHNPTLPCVAAPPEGPRNTLQAAGWDTAL
jgi:hypothetical protein